MLILPMDYTAFLENRNGSQRYREDKRKTRCDSQKGGRYAFDINLALSRKLVKTLLCLTQIMLPYILVYKTTPFF